MLFTVFWVCKRLVRLAVLSTYLQLEDFSERFDVDLPAQISSSDSGGTIEDQRLQFAMQSHLHLSQTSHLGREIESLSLSQPTPGSRPVGHTIKLTLSVKTIHVPSTFGTKA